MPIVRKILNCGKNSYGVTLPKSWLKFYEKRNGQPIRKVGMEVDGKIVIWPILKEWE